jgi:hypothetical protein
LKMAKTKRLPFLRLCGKVVYNTSICTRKEFSHGGTRVQGSSSDRWFQHGSSQTDATSDAPTRNSGAARGQAVPRWNFRKLRPSFRRLRLRARGRIGSTRAWRRADDHDWRVCPPARRAGVCAANTRPAQHHSSSIS